METDGRRRRIKNIKLFGEWGGSRDRAIGSDQRDDDDDHHGRQ